MADFIGRTQVPDNVIPSGLTFPFVSDYPVGFSRAYPIIEHRFGDEATLAVQRFQVGFGPRRFEFQRTLSFKERATLTSSMIPFFQAVTGIIEEVRVARSLKDRVLWN